MPPDLDGGDSLHFFFFGKISCGLWLLSPRPMINSVIPCNWLTEYIKEYTSRYIIFEILYSMLDYVILRIKILNDNKTYCNN